MPRYAPLKTWIAVQSSNVESVWYDAEAEFLKVKFLAKGKSPSRTWGYSGVPLMVFVEMLDAPSKGKFVHKRLKDRFVGTEL